MTANIPGRDIGIIVYQSYGVIGDTQDIRHDLAKRGIGALPDLGCSRQKKDVAEIINLDNGPTAIGSIDARSATDMPHPGQTNTPHFIWRR